jgi:hypothetical protein
MRYNTGEIVFYLKRGENTMDWTSKQAAEAWGYEDDTYVKKLCQKGRIPGAYLGVKDSRAVWIIPEQPKPEKLKPGRKGRK